MVTIAEIEQKIARIRNTRDKAIKRAEAMTQGVNPDPLQAAEYFRAAQTLNEWENNLVEVWHYRRRLARNLN